MSTSPNGRSGPSEAQRTFTLADGRYSHCNGAESLCVKQSVHRAIGPSRISKTPQMGMLTTRPPSVIWSIRSFMTTFPDTT